MAQQDSTQLPEAIAGAIVAAVREIARSPPETQGMTIPTSSPQSRQGAFLIVASRFHKMSHCFLSFWYPCTHAKSCPVVTLHHHLLNLLLYLNNYSPQVLPLPVRMLLCCSRLHLLPLLEVQGAVLASAGFLRQLCLLRGRLEFPILLRKFRLM